MRLAWFSPLPPDPSGIAAYTHEVVPLLRRSFRAIDLYTDAVGQIVRAAPSATAARSTSDADLPAVPSAHDFVWRHRRHPYDLIVYQLGNSASHDFIWAYLFRYPGLLVLHDAQVHQARALWLLRRLEPRLDDYLAEVRASHPEAPPDLGLLFAAGLGGSLYRLWPLVGLALRASRLTAVHNAHLASALSRAHADASVTAIDMGVADPLADGPSDAAGRLRAHYDIPPGACVIGAYGGLTPEKRIPQLLEAVAGLNGTPTPLHVLLVGQRAGHYDVDADIRRLGLASRVHVAGYVPDAELAAHLAAADVCWCLRWPSNGETSASWLRCLGTGRPTLITALAQLRDVPVLRVDAAGLLDGPMDDAVGVAVDPVDERRDMPRALTSLAADADLRRRLGQAARRYWEARHTLPRMAAAYERLIRDAAVRSVPTPDLPPHLRDDGTRTAQRILSEIGLEELPW
ncbi:MAG: glycosyltransferase family 4 protein [Acidobacteriota bacterium]|nr:glycosyltransferase family 4 protein [Acidobacteriota bacterium]